jgi:hypothetical protein
MKLKLLLSAISFFAILESVSATIIRVPEDYSTIQSAIDAAISGDTVLVAPNTYYENINFLGKDILVTSHYLLANDIDFIIQTVINGSQPNHPDTASCVFFINGETNNAILQGFTLMAGKGTRWQDIHIGGFYREGGGILIELASPTIQYNLITYNNVTDKTNCTSAGGGAIRCGDGDPIIQNNVITFNQGLYGGGIVMNFATGIIRNNVIYQNGGGMDFGGGGIWSYASGPTLIENNTIINNNSNLDGGGILIWSTSATIRNNIIWHNSAFTGGDQIGLRGGGTVDVTYSNVENGWQGEGNINAFPEFFAYMNFTLADTSLCIDAGNPDSTYNDPQGNPGMALWPAKGTVRNDMGAYGGPYSAELSNYFTVSVDDDKKSNKPLGFYLKQNFPNPFNPSTKIKFTIPQDLNRETQDVKLVVYDVLGNEIATLVNEEKPSGSYSVELNATSLPSGIYFYRLQAGDFIKTKKMVLMK